MIELALKTFLTTPSNGDQTQTARNTARNSLAGAIGNRVWIGRRPQESLTPSITMQRLSAERYNDLNGEPTTVPSTVDLTIWGRQDQYSPGGIIEAATEWLRLALTQYRGTMGTLDIQGITIINERMITPVAPTDASDNWLFGYTTDFLIHHSQSGVTAL